MLMEVVDVLRAAGIEVDVIDHDSTSDRSRDGVLVVTAGDVGARFAVEQKARAPYPSELSRRVAPHPPPHERDLLPLLVTRYVSEPVATALRSAGWCWADTQGNFDIRAPGMVLRQRRTTSPPKPSRGRAIPQGSGASGIVRALIRGGRSGAPHRTGDLATSAKVSQPRASQVLARLHDLGLVEGHRDGGWQPNRAMLLDRFLADYRGPGGSELYYYGLAEPGEIAARMAHIGGASTWAVSADVGPDLLVPWRRPGVLVLYANGEVDTDALGLVPSQGRHDANVLIRTPADRSIFPDRPLVARIRDTEVRLADEAQLLWDLDDLGGEDRLEAAGMIRAWLLNRP